MKATVPRNGTSLNRSVKAEYLSYSVLYFESFHSQRKVAI